jgi:chitodextrinase/lysophospholipase L1-like esterase
MSVGTGLAGAYFARTNLTLDKFARVDSTINFNWASAHTPAKSLGTDGFSVRWVGRVMPKFSEAYTFLLTTSGGARLWINNTLVIDAWSSHSLRQDTGSIALHAASLYNIRIDYWSDGSSPQAKLEWQSNRLPREIVPTNRLFASALDGAAPTTPPRLRSVSTTASSITLGWDPSSDPSGVVAYDVYVGSSKIGTTSPGQMTYSRSGLAAHTGYTFSVQAVDAAANLSAPATTAVTTAAPSNLAPSVPGSLHVTDVSTTTVLLAWNASTDDKPGVTYRVYRNGVKLNILVTDTNFTDTGLTSGTGYSYVVRAVDSQGAFSGASSTVNTATSQPHFHDPYGGITAADFDQQSGGIGVSGSDITGLDDAEWVRYQGMQFNNGANSVFFQLSLPSSNRGGWIELHLDSVDGQLIATHNVQPTGSFSTFNSEQLNLNTTVSGTHDLFVVFRGRSGVADLRSIQFKSQRLIRIMALGDSITQQSSASPSYRYYLWQELQNEGFGVDFVGSQTQTFTNNGTGDPPNFGFDQNHEGHANMRADEILSHVHDWASANVPDIVLLHVGTNDIRQGFAPSDPIGDIANIISALRDVNPNVKILLAQIIPLSGFEDQVNQFNALIPGLASDMTTEQSPIIVVDQHTGFSLSNTQDGIHPDSTGDSQMADRWMDALRPLLS